MYNDISTEGLVIILITLSLCHAIVELDVNGLTESFGLLHIPYMPELRGLKKMKCDVNTDMIPYK